ncbi:hypothetical protein D9M71_546960 [compost metagenome]
MLDADAAGQQPVVAQDQDVAVAQVGHQPLLLVQVQGDAFVVVVHHPAVVGQGVLGDWQQAIALGRHCGTVAGVGMQHGLEVGAGAVDGAVNHITGLVDAQAQRVVDDRAVHVHFHQVGRGDLVEQQAEGIDQKVLIGPRHPGREVRVDVVGPAQ